MRPALCLLSIPGSATIYTVAMLRALGYEQQPQQAQAEEDGYFAQIHTGPRPHISHPLAWPENFTHLTAVVPLRSPRDVLLTQAGRGMPLQEFAGHWQDLRQLVNEFSRVIFVQVINPRAVEFLAQDLELPVPEFDNNPRNVSVKTEREKLDLLMGQELPPAAFNAAENIYKDLGGKRF